MHILGSKPVFEFPISSPSSVLFLMTSYLFRMIQELEQTIRIFLQYFGCSPIVSSSMHHWYNSEELLLNQRNVRQ